MGDNVQLKTIEEVIEILLNPLLEVRPLGNQVPELFQGLLIGELFSKLIRMNEGDYHRLLKLDIKLALMTFSQADIEKTVREVIISTNLKVESAETLTIAIASYPVLVVAALIGMKIDDSALFLTKVTQLSGAIVEPHNQEVVRQGNRALTTLYEQMIPAKGPLKQKFKAICKDNPFVDEVIINFNLLGLFFQTLDGTSGLIAQMLKRLESAPLLTNEALLNWSLQHHAPIKNTKRFRGKEMLILPLQFKENTLPFGSGRHECPGQFWAKTITITIVEYLRALPIEKCWLLKSRYKTSPNAQVLEFYS